VPPDYFTYVEAQQGRGEDRVATITLPDRVIAIVADGAGGVSGGAEAAESLCVDFVSFADTQRGSITGWGDWLRWFRSIDQRMSTLPTCGLAAAVVVDIHNDGSLTGASVGDCEAWIFGGGRPREALTSSQCRKPLLGSGKSVPVPFSAHLSGGTLVVGSDGLWKYAKVSQIVEAANVRPLEAATLKLIDAARLKNGKLQDDVAVFVYTGAK
jgi:serine/threonine protein phosphatase PrpC